MKMDKSDLEAIRAQLDSLDRNISRLLQKRMELVSRISEYKKRTGTGVLDEAREKNVVDNVLSTVEDPKYRECIKATFESIMEHSREYQRREISGGGSHNRRYDRCYKRRYALIGNPLSHSLSPAIHDLFFKKTGIDAAYELLEVPSEEFCGILDRIKKEGYSGINVTIPYKTQIMELLDSLSQEAVRVGAVNTIKIGCEDAGYEYIGYNTDYFGFGRELKHVGATVENKTCAVLGSGGASRAVTAYLEDHGASKITIVTRNTKSAVRKVPGLQCTDIKEFSAEGFDLVINATPVGMWPKAEYSPLSEKQLGGAGFVMDLIYNPEETLLLKISRGMGIPCANGLYMLVAQAVCSQEIWQESAFEPDITDEIYKEIKQGTENQ